MQTSIQNNRSIWHALGAKIEVYADFEESGFAWVDIGATAADVDFILRYSVYSGEAGTFNLRSNIPMLSGATLTFSSVEIRPDVYSQIMAKAFPGSISTAGHKIEEFDSSILDVRQFRITAEDEYGNARTLTIYNGYCINSAMDRRWLGLQAQDVSVQPITIDCQFDAAGDLFTFVDAASYDYEYTAILGDAVTDFLLGDASANLVLGDPLSDRYSVEGI